MAIDRSWVASFNPEALFADGFEAAIIGVAVRCSENGLVVYDARKCLDILIERDGMDEDEAIEYFMFNTLGSWAGRNTPLFLWRIPEEEDHADDLQQRERPA